MLKKFLSTHADHYDVRIGLKVLTSLRSPPSGTPPPERTPAASHQHLQSLSLAGKIDLKVWAATSTQNIKQGRSRWQTGIRQTRWEEKVIEDASGVRSGVGAGRRRTEGRPHFKLSADVRFISFRVCVCVLAGSEAHVRIDLKVWTSLRSPPYGAGEGTSPPYQTPAAFPTTFLYRRIRRILIFMSDYPKHQTKSIWPENWNSVDSSRMKSYRGRCWSLLGWRRALAGAVRWRTEGRSHFKIRADAGEGVDVRISLKMRSSLHSPPSGADDGVPPPEWTPEESLITFSSRRVRRIPVFR
ncbi:hypothetical protein ACLB2K_019883 [Fragaria x ananassa]